jgi:hypothetical protein
VEKGLMASKKVSKTAKSTLRSLASMTGGLKPFARQRQEVCSMSLSFVEPGFSYRSFAGSFIYGIIPWQDLSFIESFIYRIISSWNCSSAKAFGCRIVQLVAHFFGIIQIYVNGHGSERIKFLIWSSGF